MVAYAIGGCLMLGAITVFTANDYRCPTPKEHQVCARSYPASCEPSWYPGANV